MSEPIRTCVGCRERAARSELVRYVLVGERIVVDIGRTQPGRGVWLHDSADCRRRAERTRGLARGLRVRTDMTVSHSGVASGEQGPDLVTVADAPWRATSTDAVRGEPESGYSAHDHSMSTQQ